MLGLHVACFLLAVRCQLLAGKGENKGWRAILADALSSCNLSLLFIFLFPPPLLRGTPWLEIVMVVVLGIGLRVVFVGMLRKKEQPA